uniref:Elf4 domain-containing protein n=1 Tax=Gongylonema pulchrum TaxID=637853 RepID=A0A183EWW5_9BILA
LLLCNSNDQNSGSAADQENCVLTYLQQIDAIIESLNYARLLPKNGNTTGIATDRTRNVCDESVSDAAQNIEEVQNTASSATAGAAGAVAASTTNGIEKEGSSSVEDKENLGAVDQAVSDEEVPPSGESKLVRIQTFASFVKIKKKTSKVVAA